MQILNYSEEHEIFRRSLRRFVEKELAPHVDDWEQAGIVPREFWEKLGDQGYLCMGVAEEYGGLGADFLFSVIVGEEMVRGGVVGLAAPLHTDIVVPYIESFGSEELKKKYLPGCVSGECITAIAMTEPGTGSDLAAIKTTATPDGDDQVILDGQKTFISNGILCDLCVVAARNPAIEDAHAGLDLYLVEAGTPGFEKGKQIKKIGWHSQDTAELFFEGCRVPVANRLGLPGSGFMMLMDKLAQERLMVCIMAVTAAEHMLEMTIEYCQDRQAFGRPLSKFQNTQFTLVDIATEIRLGRTFLDKLVADHMDGENIVIDVSMAKYWTAEMCMRVADRCVQLHGGYGYCEEYPIARLWRDARVLSIFAGTSEIMKSIAAKFMGL